MRKTSDYRELTVTYPLIEETFAFYKKYLDSGRKDFAARENCCLLGHAIVSQQLKKALDKYAISLGDYKYEEIFGECILTLVEEIDRKIFDSAPAFYSYFSLRISGVVYNNLNDYETTAIDVSDIAELRDSSNEDLEESSDIANLNDVYFVSNLPMFLKRFSKVERKAIRYIFVAKTSVEEEICNPNILQARYGIKPKRSEYLFLVTDLILRLLVVSYRENIELRDGIHMTDNKKVIDKFYLMLILLDSFPYLPELYKLFGEKIFLLMRVLEGKQLALPTMDQLKNTALKASVYSELGNSKETEDIDRVAKKYKIGTAEVNDIIETIDKKTEELWTTVQ